MNWVSKLNLLNSFYREGPIVCSKGTLRFPEGVQFFRGGRGWGGPIAYFY